MTSVPESVCDTGATLGEGPVWIGRDSALWFVDIKQKRIYRFDPAGGSLRSFEAPEQVGWVLPANDGTLLAGLQSGIHRFDPDTGAFSLVAEVEPDRPANRLNDAASDPSGRIWFGSMDDSERGATGEFYRFERGQVAHAGLPSVAITNGPALSPDGRILYYVDTLGGLIHAADVGDDGTLTRPRLFATIPPEEGHPDGPTVDSEGCVWIGLFGGSEARRYSPGGELIDRVRFPVSNITKLAFGGEDLRTVYATTARLHLKPEQLERQPQAGNLFAFRADVAGVPVTPAAL
ncbi:MAG TPA: SMP-30/gluconolactonase/LRE family protein [Allosphingosinicella sp.]|jgi:sugar lactone lactonase YvrE|nr:SMP-30/gluconolactonase/LRE family protein [Allosphingosinicella sp.]